MLLHGLVMLAGASSDDVLDRQLLLCRGHLARASRGKARGRTRPECRALLWQTRLSGRFTCDKARYAHPRHKTCRLKNGGIFFTCNKPPLLVWMPAKAGVQPRKQITKHD